MNPETLAKWSAPKEVPTKYGPRILRTASVTEAFSAAWKTQKDGLKAAGCSFAKSERTGEWSLCWWQPLPTAVTEQRETAKAASRQADSDFRPPCPDGLEYLPFQRAGIEYVLRTFGITSAASAAQMKKGEGLSVRGCLIADEMGL